MSRHEGQRLAQLRRRRGLTQHEVAEMLSALPSKLGSRSPAALGVNGQMISKWERGIKRPSPVYRQLYSELFEVEYESLWGCDGLEEDATKRRDVIRLGTVAATSILVGGSKKTDIVSARSPALSPSHTTRLFSCIQAIEDQYEYVNPQVFTELLSAHQSLAVRLLESTAIGGQRLQVLDGVSRLMALDANVAFNRGDFAVAENRAKDALALAREADVPLPYNWSLVNLAMIYLYTGRYQQCIEATQSADLRGRSSTAYLLNFRARAFACRGESRSARKAVAESYEVMDALSDSEQGDPGFSIDTYNRLDLDCETVSVFARLGETRTAMQYADETLRRVDYTDKSGMRAQFRISLAETSLSSGHVEWGLENLLTAKRLTVDRRPWWFDARLAEVATGALRDVPAHLKAKFWDELNSIA